MTDLTEQLPLFDEEALPRSLAPVIDPDYYALQTEDLQIRRDELNLKVQAATEDLQLRRDELDFKIQVAKDIKDFLYKVLEESQKM